ncbi:MAG: hypothetical protein OIF36_00125 [Alphaproteobacteria bacterium]|nr:hypothetical protein [Alphaproteobacteria bacterium]
MKHSLLVTLAKISPDNFIPALAEQCLDLSARENSKRMSPANAKFLINKSVQTGYHKEVIRVINKAKNLETNDEVQSLIKKALRPKIDSAHKGKKAPVVKGKQLLIVG